MVRRGTLDVRGRAWEQNKAGWRMVRLGISVPRSYVCWCCLEAKGLGMNHGTTTYCMRCWEPRSRELPCQHELPAQPARQIAV